jgi:hypothetical protein
MKIIGSVLILSILLFCTASFAQVKPCEELKSDIEKKLTDKGVVGFTLEIVPAADIKDQKVVGSCDGGKNKITYTRGAAAETTKNTESAPPAKKP